MFCGNYNLQPLNINVYNENSDFIKIIWQDKGKKFINSAMSS